MSQFINLLRMDMRRSIFSVRFILVVIGITLVLFFSSFYYLLEGSEHILYIFRITLSIGTFRNMLIVLCTIPYATSFYEDINDNFFNCIKYRTTVVKYSLSKVVMCAISSGLALALGIIVYMLILRIKMPLVIVGAHNYNSACTNSAYGTFLMEGYPILYFGTFIYLLSIGCGFFSIFGLVFSAYLPKKLIPIISPFIAYFIFNEIDGWINNTQFSVNKLMRGYTFNTSILVNILWASIVFFVLDIILYIVFEKKMKERFLDV